VEIPSGAVAGTPDFPRASRLCRCVGAGSPPEVFPLRCRHRENPRPARSAQNQRVDVFHRAARPDRLVHVQRETGGRADAHRLRRAQELRPAAGQPDLASAAQPQSRASPSVQRGRRGGGDAEQTFLPPHPHALPTGDAAIRARPFRLRRRHVRQRHPAHARRQRGLPGRGRDPETQRARGGAVRCDDHGGGLAEPLFPQRTQQLQPPHRAGCRALCEARRAARRPARRARRALATRLPPRRGETRARHLAARRCPPVRGADHPGALRRNRCTPCGSPRSARRVRRRLDVRGAAAALAALRGVAGRAGCQKGRCRRRARHPRTPPARNVAGHHAARRGLPAARSEVPAGATGSHRRRCQRSSHARSRADRLRCRRGSRAGQSRSARPARWRLPDLHLRLHRTSEGRARAARWFHQHDSGAD